MAILRSAMLVLLIALSFIALAPAPAQAAEYPDVGGCGADTVEVCFPVCVTYPCYGYVCVYSSQGTICRTLGP